MMTAATTEHAPQLEDGTKTLRVLHVVGGMVRGGIETWLMHVLRATDRSAAAMDFLVHNREPGEFDDEIRSRGARIIVGPDPHKALSYGVQLQRILEAGSYDVVHAHVNHFNGAVLRAAARAGVPVRVAHSHNDTSQVQRNASVARRLYFAVMRRLMRRHATLCLAASQLAADSLFGRAHTPKPQILHYGIDLTPYSEVDGASVREELGLPRAAPVVLHVGRFMPQKNHEMLLRIAAEVVAQRGDVHFLLAGDGELRTQVEHTVQREGLGSNVHLLGVRADVDRLMLAADVFLLPSLHEGLPLVLIEAQAAGLPCVISDTISREIDAVPALPRRLALAEPPHVWAAEVLRAVDEPLTVSAAEALATVSGSTLDVRTSSRALIEAYRGR